MKKWILAITCGTGLAILAGLAFTVSRPGIRPFEGATDNGNVEPTSGLTPAETTTSSPDPAPDPDSPADAKQQGMADAVAVSITPNLDGPARVLSRQAIETLLSSHSSFAQRQQAMEQLRKAGRLDEAIQEVERRMIDDPQTAQNPAVLGQLYLQKCGTIQDVREQGILAMKADQVFDAALNLDAYNWEARFTKAVAMSYWPTQMNKGPEVMQHFVTLLEQQEQQAAQAQFAQTYLWLGNEYQKYGYVDQALDTWRRGAALFPGSSELRTKLGR